MAGPCPWEGAYKACAVFHEINSVLYDQSLILSVPIDETISPQLCKKILTVLTTHSSHLPLPFLEVIAARLPIRLFQSSIEEPGVGDLFIHGVGEPD